VRADGPNFWPTRALQSPQTAQNSDSMLTLIVLGVLVGLVAFLLAFVRYSAPTQSIAQIIYDAEHPAAKQ
jgi:hypothetical protein